MKTKILIAITVMFLIIGSGIVYAPDGVCTVQEKKWWWGVSVKGAYCPPDAIASASYSGTKDNPQITLGKGVESMTLPVQIVQNGLVQVKFRGEWLYLMDDGYLYNSYVIADKNGGEYASSDKYYANLDVSNLPRGENVIPVAGGREAYGGYGLSTDYTWRQGQIDSLNVKEYLGSAAGGYEYYEISDGPDGKGILRVPPQGSEENVAFYQVDLDAVRKSSSNPQSAVYSKIAEAEGAGRFYTVELQGSGTILDKSAKREDVELRLPKAEIPTQPSAKQPQTATTQPAQTFTEAERKAQIEALKQKEARDNLQNRVKAAEEELAKANKEYAAAAAAGKTAEMQTADSKIKSLQKELVSLNTQLNAMPSQPITAGVTTPAAAAPAVLSKAQFSSKYPQLKGEDLSKAYNTYLDANKAVIPGSAGAKDYSVTKVEEGGKIIGYIVRGEFFEKEADALSHRDNLFRQENLKGLEIIGEAGNKIYTYDQKTDTYYEITPNYDDAKNPVLKSKKSKGENVVISTNVNGVKIDTTYKLGERGKKDFQSATINGVTISDQISLDYVTNAIKSAGKNVNIQAEAGSLSIMLQGRHVFDYSQEKTGTTIKETLTQYDANGLRTKTSVRNDYEGKRQVVEETVYKITSIKGKEGEAVKYTAEGITYSFTYNKDGGFEKRERKGYAYVDQDGREYKATVKDGELQFDANVPDEIKTKMKSGFTQAKVREGFAMVDYALDTYVGMGFYSSLFMSEESLKSWRSNVDKIFNNVVLGGPRYWASKICETQYDMSSDSIAYAEKPGGILMPSAHVEAEKSTLVNIPYANQMLQGRLYKMSFYVEASYSDIEFNVHLIGKTKTTKLFTNNIVLKGDEDGKGDNYNFNCLKNSACTQYSFNEYDKICVKFDKQGEMTRNEICNKIVESDYSYNNYINSGSPQGELSSGNEEIEMSAGQTQQQNPVQI